MKKLFAILFVAGMASLAACTSKTEGSADSTSVDTTATSVAAPADSVSTDSTATATDSTQK